MKETILANFQQARQMLEEYELNHLDNVADAAQLIIDCYEKGGTVYLCGNGGSACDAQHIAGELIGRYLINRTALPAVSLTADTSVLTCIGNDFGFELVFAKQMEGLARENNLLWAFSCSGTSANIINAAKVAKEKGCKIIAFTGKSDTPLEEMADVTIAVPAPYAGPAQQVHMVVYHTICQIVEAHFFGDTAK